MDADEVIITETPREGWSVAARGRDGRARPGDHPGAAPRRAGPRGGPGDPGGPQDSGLEVADRIALEWHAADPEAVEALREHTDLVAAEVLATSVAELAEAPSGDGVAGTDAELGLSFRITKA